MIQLKPVQPRRLKRGTYLGMMHTAEGVYLGDLHKRAEGGYVVLSVECGMVNAESDPIPGSAIRRAGVQSLSASQQINLYRAAV